MYMYIRTYMYVYMYILYYTPARRVKPSDTDEEPQYFLEKENIMTLSPDQKVKGTLL